MKKSLLGSEFCVVTNEFRFRGEVDQRILTSHSKQIQAKLKVHSKYTLKDTLKATSHQLQNILKPNSNQTQTTLKPNSIQTNQTQTKLNLGLQFAFFQNCRYEIDRRPNRGTNDLM